MYFSGVLSPTVGAGIGLPTAVFEHCAISLQDGRIFVMGGSTNNSQSGNYNITNCYFATITGDTMTWSAATPFPDGFTVGATIVQLPDGRLMVVGGNVYGPHNYNQYYSNSSTRVYYGVISGSAITWASGSATGGSYGTSGHTMTTLPDGRVLMIGGSQYYSPALSVTQFGVSSGNTTTWVNGTAYPIAIICQTATVLPDGRILVIGGRQSNTGVSISNTYFGTISGNTITWVAGTALPSPRAEHTATLLPNGTIMVTGGQDAGYTNQNTIYFGTISGNTITWVTSASTLQYARYSMTANFLADGRIFIAGGADAAIGVRSEGMIGTIHTATSTVTYLDTVSRFTTDIVGILTGSITAQSGLSSDWAASTFANTVSPGWTLHDSAAGPAVNNIVPVVIRAPWADDPTKYKYVKIESVGTNVLNFNGYETWNETTHTGTNPIMASIGSSTFQSFTVGAQPQVVISASPNGFYIQGSTSLITAATQWIMVSDYTRDDPWSTVTNGYPSWHQNGGQLNSLTTSGCNGGIPRGYSPSTGNDVVSALFTVGSPSYPGMVFTPNGQTISTTPISASAGGQGLGGQNSIVSLVSTSIAGADATKSSSKYLYEIAIRPLFPANTWSAGAILGGNISNVFTHLYYFGYTGSYGDSVFIAGQEYLLTGNYINSSIRLAIKKA